MQSYTRQTGITTYLVDKTLLGNIEFFLCHDVPKILNLIDSSSDNADSIVQQFKDRLVINLRDPQGEERLQSIKDFRYQFFSNDLQRIEVEINVSKFIAPKEFDLKLRFARVSDGADLSILISDENAKEKVSAIETGIKNSMESNKNFNWLLWPKYELLATMVGLVCLFAGILAISGDYNRRQSFYLGTLFWLAILYFVVFRYLKGYCCFDTRKQKELDKLFVWLFTGIIGFVLFTSLLTGIRKSVFGF